MATPLSTTDEDQLFHAAANGNVEATKRLVAKGVNIRLRDQNGWLALDRALSRGNTNVAFLLENSVDSEAVFLITAAYHGAVEVVRALLDRGVNVNSINESGETALMFAALMGQRKVIELLLSHNADPHIKNAKGEDATRYALAFVPNVDKCNEFGINTISTLLMPKTR